MIILDPNGRLSCQIRTRRTMLGMFRAMLGRFLWWR